ICKSLPDSANATPSGNGVERGAVGENRWPQLSQAVQDKVEKAIFENCNMQGATDVWISSTWSTHNEGVHVDEFYIQYKIEFPKEKRTYEVFVDAYQYLPGAMKSGIEINGLGSSICHFTKK